MTVHKLHHLGAGLPGIETHINMIMASDAKPSCRFLPAQPFSVWWAGYSRGWGRFQLPLPLPLRPTVKAENSACSEAVPFHGLWICSERSCQWARTVQWTFRPLTSQETDSQLGNPSTLPTLCFSSSSDQPQVGLAGLRTLKKANVPMKRGD